MKTLKLIIPIFILLFPGLPVMTAQETAPGFALPDSQGAMVFKSSLQGNILISFFASYCRPCTKELPMLLELEKKYGKQKNLSLVLIAADANDADGDAKDKAGRFLSKIGVDHVFLMDSYQIVIAKYNPKKELPATFLVDRYGYIVFKEVGAREDTIRRLERAIQCLR